MIALLQRVSEAAVHVDGLEVGAIRNGLLALVAVERYDSEKEADRLLERLLNYRVFTDSRGHMNESLRDIGGGLLLVPQFTLPADTRKGNRPGFSKAASPALGNELFEYFTAQADAQHARVACGRFGADMRVSLVNEGPVTFWLQVAPAR